MRWLERNLMLQVIDQQWKDHLLAIDHLRSGIYFQAYRQVDPLVAYKQESYKLFTAMQDRIDAETIRMLFNIQFQIASPRPAPASPDDPALAERLDRDLEERLVRRRRKRAARK